MISALLPPSPSLPTPSPVAFHAMGKPSLFRHEKPRIYCMEMYERTSWSGRQPAKRRNWRICKLSKERWFARRREQTFAVEEAAKCDVVACGCPMSRETSVLSEPSRNWYSRPRQCHGRHARPGHRGPRQEFRRARHTRRGAPPSLSLGRKWAMGIILTTAKKRKCSYVLSAVFVKEREKRQ